MTKVEFNAFSRRHRWSIRAAKQDAAGSHDESAVMIRNSIEFYSRQRP